MGNVSIKFFLRRHALSCVLIVLLTPVYLAWGWSPYLGNFGGDAAIYMTTAQHYDERVPDPMMDRVAATSRFPPLYSAWLVGAGSAHDLRRAHAATVAALLLGLLALSTWSITAGVKPPVAALLSAFVALLPGTYFLALFPQSEYLYFFLSLVALACMERAVRGARRWFIAAAMAVGVAVLTRSIGIALVPALIACAWRARLAGKAIVLALALAPIAPAALWVYRHPAPVGYGDVLQDFYGTEFLSALRRQVLGEMEVLPFGFIGNFIQTSGLFPIAAALGICCLAAGAVRWRRGAPDGWYIAAYLCIVALWPFPVEVARLLWPIVPVMLGQSLLVLQSDTPLGGRMAATTGWLQFALCAGVATLIAPMLLFSVDRYSMGVAAGDGREHIPEWYVLDPHAADNQARSHLALEEFLGKLARSVPPSDCVISVKPPLLRFFAHRDGVTPPPPEVPDAQFSADIAASPCRYMLVLALKDDVYRSSLYPLRRLEGNFEIRDILAIPGADGRNQNLAVLLSRLPATAPTNEHS